MFAARILVSSAGVGIPNALPPAKVKKVPDEFTIAPSALVTRAVRVVPAVEPTVSPPRVGTVTTTSRCNHHPRTVWAWRSHATPRRCRLRRSWGCRSPGSVNIEHSRARGRRTGRTGTSRGGQDPGRVHLLYSGEHGRGCDPERPPAGEHEVGAAKRDYGPVGIADVRAGERLAAA